MEEKIVLKGRPAFRGYADGEAMVCPNSIQGWAGVNSRNGVIIESGHIHEGETYNNKILVVPTSKGSCGWSSQFQGPLDNAGIKPAGWVVSYADSKVGVAAVIVGAPMVADFQDVNIFDVIEDGDWVTVDGDKGIVTVTKKK